MPYRFRVEFQLVGEKPLKDEVDTYAIHIREDIPPFDLHPVGADLLSQTNRFVLTGPEYPTEEEAHRIGQDVYAALCYYSLTYRKGIDLGSEAAGGGFTTHGLKWLEDRFGQRMINGRLGLTVYDVPPQPRFPHSNLRAQVSSPAEHIQRAVIDSFGKYRLTDDAVTTAGQLFGLSFFEASTRSRLLALMMACEALVAGKRQTEGKEVISWIEKFLKELESSDASSQAKDKLRSKIGNLRLESISQCGARLAGSLLTGASYNNKPPDTFFRWLYGKRSALLHESGIDIESVRTMITATEEFTRDLILAFMKE